MKAIETMSGALHHAAEALHISKEKEAAPAGPTGEALLRILELDAALI